MALSDADLDQMVRDFGEILATGTPQGFLAPEFVVDLSRSNRPDAGVYLGVDSALALYESMREALLDLRWQGRVVDRPTHDLVVLESGLSGRGRTSGIESEGKGASIWKLRDGKLAETILFQSLDDARAHLHRLELAKRVADARLYFVCEARPNGGDPRPILDAAIRGGAAIVQLRDKQLGDEELVEAARPFREAADAGDALFILNDRPDLVAACEADGVHVGQDDVPVAAARRAAGEAALVGLSTHRFAEVEDAKSAMGIARPDHISVGPVWETPTKEGRPGTGLGLIEFAAAEATVPWFAIGGVAAETVGEVVEAGASRAVVVRAIRDADDPETAARQITDALGGTRRDTSGRADG